MCPGRTKSPGRDSGSMASSIVLARALAETPVVTACRGWPSIEMVKGVPRTEVLTAAWGVLPLGLGLGLALLLLPYIMGGIGAGDVKALGALGALIGPYDLIHVFIYMGLYGGVLALFHYCYKTNIKNNLRELWFSACASILTREVGYITPPKPGSSKASMRFPYSAAIALGYYSFVYWGGLL